MVSTVVLLEFLKSEYQYEVKPLCVVARFTVTDFIGNDIDPAEFKIKLTKKYSPFAVMASAAVLLLVGIKPDVF